MRFLSFTVVTTLLLTYLAIRVAQLARAEGWARWAIYLGVALVFVAGIGAQILYRERAIPPEAGGMNLVNLVSFTGIGFLVTIALILIPVDVATLLYKVAMKGAERLTSFERRELIGEGVVRGAELALLGGAALASLTGLASARTGPKVKEVRVPLGRALGTSGRELRIAQISDLHVGPTILEDYVESVVERTNALNPDLIALTGDMVDGTWEQLERHVAPLSKLKAPLGVFYVSGNHEYYWGGERWIERFARMGMTVLENENRVVDFHGARIQIAGVPDPAGERFFERHRSDPEAAMLSPAPREAIDLRILLAHRPAACFAAARAGFDLQLSGHTHAGQFFPWAFYVPLAHPYSRGLNLHEKTWVYVNAGTGYWGPPNRFGVPSEITLLRVNA